MAYNTTKEQQDEAFLRDTKEKLRREAILTAALLRGYFRPVSKSFFDSYKKVGIIPNLDEHTQNLNEILNAKYTDTSQKFIRQVRDALGRPENDAEIDDAINANQGMLQEVDVSIGGKSIANTTEKQLNNSVNEILKAAAFAGLTLSQLQVAKAARKKFNAMIPGRLSNISMTETEGASESAKKTEVTTLIQKSAIFPIARVLMAKAITSKRWITKRDSRVRPAHVLADNQVKPFDIPFVVGGELLMEPKDSSLGASLANIIRCRCASIITIRRSRT